MGSTPGSGRSPGVESGNSLQYTGLEISMDRGIYSPWGYKELDLTDHTHTHTHTHTERQNSLKLFIKENFLGFIPWVGRTEGEFGI